MGECILCSQMPSYMVSALWISPCDMKHIVLTFLVATTKFLSRSNLKRDRSCSNLQLEEMHSILLQKAWRQ